MIIKNYAPGIVNGTLCKLISYSRDIVHVQLLTGAKKRSVVMLPRCTFYVLPGQIVEFCFTRHILFLTL
jgi:hypothetical protein